MEKEAGAIIIIIVCAIVLLIVAARKKSEIIINFVLRSVFGVIFIYFINEILLFQGFLYEIEINIVTILTSGILGFPGILLLYGIKIYSLL
ncbi:MAG: pro-sigmaK processing inhibitor BofA family protein [Eubacteriales bacterium]